MLFYLNMVLSVFLTAMVLFAKNYLHAVLYFLLSIIFMSLAIYSLGSPLSSMILIIVYAGAIVTLFIFVIMMLGLKNKVQNSYGYFPVLTIAILMFEFFYLIDKKINLEDGISSIDYKEVSRLLFMDYAFLTEISSIILMAALIGGFHLGARYKR